jgi:uncharacterized cysteine cluster protein YcgN (CxxCxxCC family)
MLERIRRHMQMHKQKRTRPFWETKNLEELSHEQWESLCDRCARCCLLKLEFEDTGELCYTHLVCRYYDEQGEACTCYGERTMLVPACVKLTPQNLAAVHFMPATCAYRLLSEGQCLPWWHPLVSGGTEAVHAEGISIRGRVVSEDRVDEADWEKYIVDWVD